mgnify:CR=1 FL=1|jgi:hypothetical protein
MKNKQLHLTLNPLKVGDLVKEQSWSNNSHQNPNKHKTMGVVVEVDTDAASYQEAIKVHWVNYGSFWTIGDKLFKINKKRK